MPLDPWWTDPLLVVLGAATALLGQLILERWRSDRRRRVILLALEEELHAVAFKPGAQAIGGFSSQTFDELFSDIARLLPPETARRLIRYHLRMKHLVARRHKHPEGIQHVQEMEALRDELVKELETLQPVGIRMARKKERADER